MPQRDVSELWIQQLRRNNKTTPAWSCTFCEDRRIFTSAESLWSHASLVHPNRLPVAEDEEARESFRRNFEAECADKRCV